MKQEKIVLRLTDLYTFRYRLARSFHYCLMIVSALKSV
jgi:hypothetical protein